MSRLYLHDLKTRFLFYSFIDNGDFQIPSVYFLHTIFSKSTYHICQIVCEEVSLFHIIFISYVLTVFSSFVKYTTHAAGCVSYGVIIGTSGEYVYGARLAIRVTYQICPRISRLSLLMREPYFHKCCICRVACYY